MTNKKKMVFTVELKDNNGELQVEVKPVGHRSNMAATMNCNGKVMTRGFIVLKILAAVLVNFEREEDVIK